MRNNWGLIFEKYVLCILSLWQNTLKNELFYLVDFLETEKVEKFK